MDDVDDTEEDVDMDMDMDMDDDNDNASEEDNIAEDIGESDEVVVDVEGSGEDRGGGVWTGR
jgi:hypothetical protein